ncbi:MAG: aldo/keto reductase [Chloroflexi bacterium]|nr:aldo/keto reductase [Chloroflexota bacterium]MCL5275600.1 aldo/keto reductase [Chloroflexota bacterium]
MNTQQLGVSDLKVTRIAYGSMPLGGSWDGAPAGVETRENAVKIIRTALDEGINFYDHADIYCRGKSEEVFSGIWQEAPSLREKIFLQSKCGIRPGWDDPSMPTRFDFSYEHIMRSVEGSLKRLKTDYLDVLLLHRPDPLVEPEEVARAFDELHQSGKVRWFGVSNETAAEIEYLSHYLRQPIIANQVEFNVIHTHMLDEGIVFNQNNPRLSRNHGTIEYCRLHNITLQAWGPLARGLLTGRAVDKPAEHISKTSTLVAQMAKEKGVTGEAILIAWIMRHPAKIQAIIGTTNTARISAACQGDGIELSRDEWYKLFVAGRGENMP